MHKKKKMNPPSNEAQLKGQIAAEVRDVENCCAGLSDRFKKISNNSKWNTSTMTWKNSARQTKYRLSDKRRKKKLRKVSVGVVPEHIQSVGGPACDLLKRDDLALCATTDTRPVHPQPCSVMSCTNAFFFFSFFSFFDSFSRVKVEKEQ